MYGVVVLIVGLLTLIVLFPQEVIQVIRNIRRWLRDDLRRRLTEEQWQEIQHEFDDL